jgi:hypothetical protein
MAQEQQEQPAGTSPTTPCTGTATVRIRDRSGVGGTTTIADCALQRVRRVGRIQPARRSAASSACAGRVPAPGPDHALPRAGQSLSSCHAAAASDVPCADTGRAPEL